MSNGQEFIEISTPIRRRLERVVTEIKDDDKMVELLRVKKLLNAVEDEYHQPQTTLSDLFAFDDANVTVQPDEFYGLTPLEAAKRYLAKRGQARPLGEIAAAIRDGGAKVSDEGELRLSLSRSTMEVAKVGQDWYGLVEFYPHVKRGRKRRGGADADATVDLDAIASEVNTEVEESGSVTEEAEENRG